MREGKGVGGKEMKWWEGSEGEEDGRKARYRKGGRG